MLHLGLELFLVVDHFHAAPTAAGCGLDDHRIADVTGNRLGFGHILDRAVAAGNKRQAKRASGPLCLDLVAHGADMLGLRADPFDVMAFDDFRELRIFGQKAVARMDCVRMADFRRRNNRRNVQIAVGGRRRSDADGFIREADVHRLGIRRRMDRDRFNSHFMRGTMDAKRNLATVGDQDFLNAHIYAITMSGWSNSTGCPLST